MHVFQNFRPLVTRVMLIVTATGVVTLFSGATWEIDAPVDMSSRTKTSMVAGSGTAGQAGIAALQFGDALGGFVVENEINVTAQSIGMGMYSWAGDLPAPAGGWTVSPEVPGMPGSYTGTHEARIKWVENGTEKNKKTTQHEVTP